VATSSAERQKDTSHRQFDAPHNHTAVLKRLPRQRRDDARQAELCEGGAFSSHRKL
jgi:hypothetical protein